MRFLNSISLSGVVVTYSKPVSIRFVASLVLVVALQWYSSFSSVSRSCVYLSVVLRSLCPNRALTCSRSLVLW